MNIWCSSDNEFDRKGCNELQNEKRDKKTQKERQSGKWDKKGKVATERGLTNRERGGW